LRLSLENPTARSLLNPRQSLPVEYTGSALNHGTPVGELRSGMVAPDAPFDHGYLSKHFGKCFTLLHFGAAGQAAHLSRAKQGIASIEVLDLPQASHELAWLRYGASAGMCALVRPDGYLMALWHSVESVDLNSTMKGCTL
jgi:3-(3-hydroxy-phenyl)propionate hydroxylase